MERFDGGTISAHVSRSAATRSPPGEKHLAKLLAQNRVGERRAIESFSPPPVSRRTRYACKLCRDTKRVKVSRDIGPTELCTACTDDG